MPKALLDHLRVHFPARQYPSLFQAPVSMAYDSRPLGGPPVAVVCWFPCGAGVRHLGRLASFLEIGPAKAGDWLKSENVIPHPQRECGTSRKSKPLRGRAGAGVSTYYYCHTIVIDTASIKRLTRGLNALA